MISNIPKPYEVTIQYNDLPDEIDGWDQYLYIPKDIDNDIVEVLEVKDKKNKNVNYNKSKRDNDHKIETSWKKVKKIKKIKLKIT